MIARYDDLERRSASLEPMVSRISRALQGSPRVQINRIDWRSGVSPDEGMSSPGSGNFTVISDVYAQLPVILSSDHRTLLDTIQVFSADLRKGATAEVRVLNLPFDIASGKSLTSSHEASVDATSFSLRIVEKP